MVDEAASKVFLNASSANNANFRKFYFYNRLRI